MWSPVLIPESSSWPTPSTALLTRISMLSPSSRRWLGSQRAAPSAGYRAVTRRRTVRTVASAPKSSVNTTSPVPGPPTNLFTQEIISILTEISASESLFVQALDAKLPHLSRSFDRRRAPAGLHAPGTRPSSVPRRAAGARAPCRIRARSASSPCQPTLLSHNMNHGDSCYESSWGASRPRSAVVIPPSARPTSGRGGSASVPAFATRNRLPPIERRKPSAI